MHGRPWTDLSGRTRFIVLWRLTSLVKRGSLMSDSSNHRQKIDSLLEAFSGGDKSALDELIPLIEPELRRLAHYNLRFQRRDQTLRTTALVNEVYLKWVSGSPPDWKNRAYFYGAASHLMRQILVKHIWERLRYEMRKGGPEDKDLERVGGLKDIKLENIPEGKDKEVLLLDEALNKLARVKEIEARVVDLHHFAGLTLEEVAEVLEISLSTVKRLWRHAKTWLRREITGK